MSQLNRRLWITAILMACGWIGTGFVRRGYTFEVQKMKHELDALPKEIAGYVGTDMELDNEIENALKAHRALNRTYTRADGASIILHAAVWISPEVVGEVTPHHPTDCYTRAGWRIIEERSVLIATTQSEKHPIGLLLLEKNNQYCTLAFWYQMDKSTFSSFNGGKRIHRNYWGKRIWPATIKFMLQSNMKDIDLAMSQMDPLAVKLYEWVASL